jgi:glycosyltransferase involved in cell wall biosynthesis/tRNA A-37 threonylcarbamoyl transferase component Bud32
MLFNETAIAAKSAYLDAILTRAGLLRDVIREFAGDEIEVAYDIIKRPWDPGGGATLFAVQFGNRKAFLKVKSAAVTVESKLEGEEQFIEIPSLRNEHEFLRKLQQISENVPQCLGYFEKEGFCFLFMEELIPYRTALATLSAQELLAAYRQIKSTLLCLFEINIVHTDVHDNNLMFRDKTPVLIDFEEARYLSQDVPFEESLDAAGENAWGNVGLMPEGFGFLSGYTCLNRLKKEFARQIIAKLPDLIKECNFDSSCSFLTALDHGDDDRIYQSINLPGITVEGQRPLEDSRIEFLLNVSEKLLKAPFTHLDIGSNLGRFNLELSRSPKILRTIGVEAYDRYVDLSKVLAFLDDSSKVEFFCAECGKDSLHELLQGQTVEFITMYSVYHHINNKEQFLKDLAKLNPSCLMIEMAAQEQCYGRSWKEEVSYIGRTMNMRYACLLAYSQDYQRPIVLLSNTPNVEKIIAGEERSVQAKTEPHAPSTPLVSVVLPTYNNLGMLRVSIKSILAQTLSGFELIIINDGSTDGARDFLDRLTDPRIRVIHQENRRLPGALNTGFEIARGKYLTWTSDDNYCSPVFLESLARALDENPDTGFAYSAFAWIDSEDRITGVCSNQDFSYSNLLRCNPGNASFMYRRECQERVGFYDPQLEGAEDWDMWLRITEQFNPVYVPEILYYYRLHDQSMTATKAATIRQAAQLTFRKATERQKNRLTVELLYPSILECKDKETARYNASLDFGTKMLSSPWNDTLHNQIAASFLEQALNMSGASLAAANLAVAYARLRQWEEALKIVHQVQTDNNHHIKRICDLLSQAHTSNDPRLLRQIPVLEPDLRSTELFRIQIKNKRVYAAPQTCIGSSDPQAPDGEIRKIIESGKGLLDSGDIEAARREFVKATVLYPESAEAYTLMGATSLHLGNLPHARASFRQALELRPEDPEALRLLASVPG